MIELTIDEAIAKEKEEEKRLRKIIETGYDGEISIEALFCDDTSAIKEAYERFENCAKEHEQRAEWLEELKAYREIGTVEECRNSVLDIERAYNKGYADGSLSVTEEIRGKAIDDFRAEIEKEYDNDYCPNVSDYLDYKISLRDLFNIAEQLKERESE